MKFNKIIIATLLLLAILTIGAVSASENLYDDSSDVSLLGDDDFDEDMDDIDDDSDDLDEDEDDDYEDDDSSDEGEEDLYVFSDVDNEMIFYSEGDTIIAYLGDLPSTAKGNFSIYEVDDLIATKTVENGKASFKLSELMFTSDVLGGHDLNAIYDDGINTYEKLFYFIIVDYKISGPKEIYFGNDAVFTVSMPSSVNGRVEAYCDDEYVGSGEVINGAGTVRVTNIPLGSYEIEFILAGEEYDVLDVCSLTVSPKISLTANAYIGADNVFSASLPKDATGFLTLEVKNLKTGKTTTLEAEYSKGKVVMPAHKLAEGSYAITDFYIEDDDYGEYSFADMLAYVGGAVFAKFKVSYPKLTLNKVKTLSKRKSSLTLKLTVGKANGKYVTGQKVTFKFKTKTYTVRTSSKGVAKVNIPKNVYQNFKVGQTVKYQAKYFKKTIKYSLKMIK